MITSPESPVKFLQGQTKFSGKYSSMATGWTLNSDQPSHKSKDCLQRGKDVMGSDSQTTWHYMMIDIDQGDAIYNQIPLGFKNYLTKSIMLRLWDKCCATHVILNLLVTTLKRIKKKR